MIATLSVDVLYCTLMALLVARLLNGCLRWAARAYPNSEIIQRINIWVDVRRPWDALKTMRWTQPPSPPKLPYDSVVDIPALPEDLFRHVASKVMRTEGAQLPRLQQGDRIRQGDAITSLQGQVLLCVEWMQGKQEPFPYLNGHLPQDDLNVPRQRPRTQPRSISAVVGVPG